MAKHQNNDAIINNFRGYIQQNTFSEDIAIPVKLSNQIDVQGTLELLNTTNEINFLTKLFLVLSASLMLNKDANFEVIIKYRTVYDRINFVLEKGLPRKAEHALNFLSTLLYVDAEDDGPTKRRTLALYAKNMTRVSGCLATMTDMFTNRMMYHDTWNALCQCLAAACGGSDLNQSYCTHLIPVCIQRCNQTNLEVFLVLQSLLPNHKRNMELFLNSNGVSIFTRELLHLDKCLQLLISVVQSPDATSLLLRQYQVLNDLRDFLRIYGPNSQIGQKAMIILKHIETQSRGSAPLINENSMELNITRSNEDAENNAQIYEYDENELDDTATLMQKVMREVFNFKQNQLAIKNAACKPNVNSLIRSTSTVIINTGGQRHDRRIHVPNTPNKTRKQVNQPRRDGLQSNTDAELSFSFLNQLNNGVSRNKDRIKAINRSKISSNQKAKTDKEMTKTFVNAENDYVYSTTSNEKTPSIESKDFRPKLSSTPKHEEFSNLIDCSKTSIRKPSLSTQSQPALLRTTRIVKRRPAKMPRNNDKNLKNTSLSSRFFSAINESCTTLVKTVASMFKKNEQSDFSKEMTESHASRADASCSFSFLNYMQKRDAVFNKILKTKNKDFTDFSVATDLCETCDTQTLKKKMARNKHLKQTVKKLKLGINLYGCDFKKISKAMWPRESYMTPIVLYNLYRKLLLK